MKILKLLLAILFIGAFVFLSISCSSGTTSTSTVATQIATVKKGNISITVTGTGNLALEYKQDLSFGETGQANSVDTSKISEVNVVAGQTVKKGQILVKADTQDWKDQVTSYQHALDSANDALLRAKDQLINDQDALTIDQNTLSQVKDVQLIQEQKDNANVQLQQAKMLLQQASTQNDSNSILYWQKMINYYSVNPTYKDKNGNTMPDGGLLGYYEQQMTNLLADPSEYLAAGAMGSSTPTGFDTSASTAQKIIDLQTTIKKDQMTIKQDQSAITLKQNAVDDAQTNLDNAKNASQEIAAPFDGLITSIYTDSNGNTLTSGDIVARNTSLVEIADPGKYVANILVTEGDVISVEVGKVATVTLDAVSGVSYPAKITRIAPLSTTSSGVVNYKVTVELTSLTPIYSSKTVSSSSSSTAGGTPPNLPAGGTPPNFPAGGAIPTNLPTGGTMPSINNSTNATTTANTSPQNITLKDGMSVTVTIPTQEKNDVLIVPSKAIKNSTVQVVKDTATVTQTIQKGITDGTNTEIISGLNEGDKVLLISSSSTNNKSTSGGGIMGGGPPAGGF